MRPHNAWRGGDYPDHGADPKSIAAPPSPPRAVADSLTIDTGHLPSVPRDGRSMINKPLRRPRSPNFSTGPCAKRPGWSLSALAAAVVGRAHRSPLSIAKLQEVIDRSRSVLGIPQDYQVAIVPGSDTGAVEMALWSLLGERGVDVLVWDSFGARWRVDIVDELKLDDVRTFEAEYGALPDLASVDGERDVVFTWNGTTAGVRVPDGEWIAAGRKGLAICDATSAAFGMKLPWDKLDVATWSWQKCLGGEAAHGMIALSPRAIARLEAYAPDRPIPRLFRLSARGQLIEGPFRGEAINTPSLLCIEDAIDALVWAESIGGLPTMIERSQENLAAIARWVQRTDWVAFLADDPSARSSTSICLKIVDPEIANRDPAAQWAFIQALVDLLAAEGIAYDIKGHRDAPPGLRIWGGPTVEAADTRALMPWLEWAFADVRYSEA